MSKPRLQVQRLSLPIPPDKYDPKHLQAVQQLIEQHATTLQPSQQRQSITGSRGSGAALVSVIALLVNLGFGIDNTVA